jgi:GNAT superfamily N-acetyltransferase
LDLTFEYLADRPGAIPCVAAWWHSAWGSVCPEQTIDELSIQIRNLASRNRIPIQILAVAADKVAGVAVLKMHEMFDLYPDRRFWLGNVFVVPECRGQGIASALAMQIVEIAGGLGAEVLHLQTTKLEGGLYGRLGWARIDQVHYRGYEALVMAKPLKGPQAGCHRPRKARHGVQ